MISAEQRFESLDGRTTMATLGGRKGPWSGLFSASRVSRDSYDLVPSEPTTSGSAFRKIGLHGKISYRFGSAADLTVWTRRYVEDADDVTASGTIACGCSRASGWTGIRSSAGP